MPGLFRVAQVTCVFILAAHFAPQAQAPYVIKTGISEVALTFRAEDDRGRTITDLKQDDLQILDNRHPASRITLFSHHEHLPLRIVLLLDISPSMAYQAQYREVARRVGDTAIHDARDQALVMFFDFEPKLMQDWTSDPKLLSAAASRTTGEARSRFGGTAIWDSTYRTCRDNIPVQTPGEETFASAIILFTDGDDNRSHALPEDVIDECQQHQTAIYPFLVDDSARRDAGQKILRSLAELTGGRVFYGQESDTNITASVLRIDTDLRDRYTVVYRPIDQKRDGKLHTIELAAPQRTAFFTTRTGYYATK